jgi:hypothetical protein
MFKFGTAFADKRTAFFHCEDRGLCRIDSDRDDNSVKQMTCSFHQIKVSVGERVE